MRLVVLGGGLLVAMALGCGDDAPGGDGGVDSCAADGDCDDGLFCTGAESCVEGLCVSGTAPCAMGESCDEMAETCRSADCADPDVDGDGVNSIACGGFDCDDDDPNRYPGNTEFCDADAHDEDCDPLTFGTRDVDGDGYPDSACCNGEGAERNCGNDCDDTRGSRHPDLAESCDGLDNDCDGMVDEEVLTTYYEDLDGDSFGDPAGAMMVACARPAGYADNANDCDDGTSARNPGNGESCVPPSPGADPIDEDCDGDIDEGCDCTVGQTRPCMEPGRCAAGIESCVDGSFGECSVDPIGEVCNGEDDDCDGAIDDGVKINCYPDNDDDGYAGSTVLVDLCPAPDGSCPPGYVEDAAVLDCDDSSAAISPGAAELCDGLDTNCDGMGATSPGGAVPAEDNDGDGYTSSSYVGCTGGYPRTDCNDDRANVNVEHTAYEPLPHCPTGRTPCYCTPSLGNDGWFCVSGSCSPTSASCTSGPRASFDWNCSGAAEVETTGVGSCSGSTCSSGPRPFGCDTTRYPSTAFNTVENCGLLVSSEGCICSGTCNFSSSLMADIIVPCR